MDSRAAVKLSLQKEELANQQADIAYLQKLLKTHTSKKLWLEQAISDTDSELQKKFIHQAEENQKLRTALETYADPRNWTNPELEKTDEVEFMGNVHQGELLWDGWEIAEKALEGSQDD